VHNLASGADRCIVGHMPLRFPTIHNLLRRKPTPGERGIDVLEAIERQLHAIHVAINQFEFPPTEPVSDVEDPRIEALERKIIDLTTALDLGVSRVQRSENRVRAIVQGARKELADAGFEHPGIEAEAGQIQPVDGTGGEPEPVPAVSVDVEDNFAPSAIPGITIGEFRRAFSRRR